MSLNFAIVGCGYVSDLYMAALKSHPELTLTGVWDRDPQRLAAFTAFHGVKGYASYSDLLADPAVQLVANLTNPREHFKVSQAALLANKHVYSEKPLATELADAQTLVELAGILAVPARPHGPAKGQLARTTHDQYGEQLHTYTIKTALDDNSVLGFQVEHVVVSVVT